MKSYIILITLVSFTIFQCGQRKQNAPPIKDTGKLEYTLVPDRIRQFSIDSLVLPNSDAIFSYVDGCADEYLYYLNDSDNSIILFSLEDEDEISKIKLSYEGPNGVGRIKGFHVLSKDSILVTPLNGGRIYLVNNTGEVLYRYEYNKHPDFSGTFKARSSTPLVVLNGKMYILQFPPSPYNKISKDQFENSTLGFTIDMKSALVENLDVNYPGSYWADGYYPPYVMRQFDGERFVYCFQYSENIYFHNKGSKALKTINLAHSVGPYEKYNVQSIEESRSRRLRSPWIPNFLFDKYNRVYYLVYYLGDETRSDFGGYSKSHLSKFKIIILNDDLQVSGSFTVKPDTYLIDNMFVGKEGLYISTNDTFNIEMDEDLLSYQLFKLVKKPG